MRKIWTGFIAVVVLSFIALIWRRDDADLFSTEDTQGMDLGARHAGVQDVTDNGHLEPFELALVAADGEHIQHRLGRMRMATVAGVDHRHIRLELLLSSGVGCAGFGRVFNPGPLCRYRR